MAILIPVVSSQPAKISTDVVGRRQLDPKVEVIGAEVFLAAGSFRVSRRKGNDDISTVLRSKGTPAFSSGFTKIQQLLLGDYLDDWRNRFSTSRFI